MRDADGGFRFVDVLTAGTGGFAGLHFDVGRRNVDFHIFDFGKNGDGCCRGLDTSLRFGFRDTLDTMNAGFVFQTRINALSLDKKRDFLDATKLRFVDGHDGNFPALPVGVHTVHPKEVRAEQCGFLTACSRTDFHDDGTVIVLVARQQQDPDFLLQLCKLCAGGGRFLFGKLCHVSISRSLSFIKQCLRVVKGGLCGEITVVGSCNRRKGTVLAHPGKIARPVGHQLGLL